jgi:uncharacterized membrane protein YcfT
VDNTAWQFLAALVWEPFGTLWFIWMLPVFAVTVRLTRHFPALAVLAAAAALQIAPIHTGWLVVDEFASRFVYYYVGYLFAPAIFAAARVVAAHPWRAALALGAWAGLNGALVVTDVADWPLVSLTLGLAGAGAILVAATLLAKVPWSAALSFVGRNSIVVYLAFFLPMAASRTVLVNLGLLDTGTVGLLVTVAAVVGPLIIWWLAMKVGARFLFERPAWARIERPARLAPAE